MRCTRKSQRVIEQGRGTPVVPVVLAQPTTRSKDLRPGTTHSAFISPAASGTTSLISKPVYNERTSEKFHTGEVRRIVILSISLNQAKKRRGAGIKARSHARPSTFRNYTRSEPRFCALLTQGEPEVEVA